MGPVGILFGSVAGGITSYKLANGSFKSAALIIRDELTEPQKEKLCDHITEAFRNFGPEDLAMLIPLITSSAQFQKIVITHIVQFLTNEMRLQIID